MATAKKAAPKDATAPTAETETAAAQADAMSCSNPMEWAAGAKEQFESVVSAFAGNFEELRDQAEELAETAQARLSAAQERAAKTNARIMEAAQEDLTSAVQFAADLGQATTFADALTVQQNYWTKLFETRVERMREFTDTALETTREAMAPADLPAFNTKAFEKLFAFPLKS